jgi:hypothetical protein
MRAFYRYYQTSEKGRWELASDHEEIHQELKSKGAVRVSFLALDKVIDDETDTDVVSYKGDFYSDIDSSDLAESIESAKTLLANLDAAGVPPSSYEVYISGSKGFHIYLHSRLYYDSRPLRKLPRIYRAMAMRLYVPGLDFQPYSGGRGNLCRLPGVKREDGKYKVRVFPDEVRAMTPDTYRQLANQPRSNVAFTAMQAPVSLNPTLASYFSWAQDFVKQESRRRANSCIADIHLAQFQAQGPQCIEDLVSGQIRPSVTFNQVAMQLGIYLARSGTPLNIQTTYIDRAATNLPSTAYPTFTARRTHLRAQVGYHQQRSDMQFSCPATRSVISTSPCVGCKLEHTSTIQDEYEVLEKPDGYYAKNEREERRLTSFILIPTGEVFIRDEENKESKRALIVARVESNHEFIGTMRIEEACWASRGNLVRAMEGLGNLKVTASDNDIQNIKHFVLRDLDKLEQQEVVGSFGMHRDVINNKPRYTWVEQGMSMNKFQVRDTHLLESAVNAKHAAMPAFKKIYVPERHDPAVIAVVKNLFTLNLPEVMAPILGWVVSCHLKTHLMGLYSQFPILSLWGGRGSGKTRTASVVCLLNGIDYETYAPPTLPTITDFALIQTLCSTTTVPRVLDEYNRAGMVRRGRYGQIGEMLKKTFNNSPEARGRLARRGEGSKIGGYGAVADYYYLTAPVCVLSEHAMELPALVDRSYKVMMSEPSILTREAQMAYLQEHPKDLIRLAKLLMTESMSVRDEWVKDRMDSWKKVIPKEYSIRQNYVRQVIGVGLDYLEHVLKEILDLNLTAEISELRHAFLHRIKDVRTEVEISGYSTEIDMFMDRLGELMMLIHDGAIQNSINGRHLKLDNGYLLIDVPPVFSHLQQYITSIRERKPVASAKQWTLLMKSEPYYAGSFVDTSMTKSRSVIKLSLAEMEKKGIDVTHF